MSGSFQQRAPIHASMPTFQGGQTFRGSYSPGLGWYGSQQRPTGRGNYSGFSGSTQQFPGQRFCFTCGDPVHLMRQCTSQRGRGGPRLNSSFQTRPPAPQGRGRGRVQSGRGDRVSSSGVAAQQIGVEVPPRIEVDEEDTSMLSPGDLRRRPLMLLLQVSSQYAIDLRLCCLIQVLHSLMCLRILLLNLI